jgi:hypothetical protein
MRRCGRISPCVACEIFDPDTGLGGIANGPVLQYCHDKAHEEMRRYLYRNVAAEYRKSLSDFHHIPHIPGWT